MTEKSNALARAQLLMLHADTIENDSIKNMVIDSATELAVLHDEIERLTADNERLTATAFQAQNAATDLAYRYQRMQEVLERIAYASSIHQHSAAHMVVSLQGIAQAALKEPSR